MVEVKESNPTFFRDIDLKLKELDGYESKVGWFETAHYPDGPPVAQVAFWQNQGVPSRSIPPRPFMTNAVVKNKQKWFDLAGQLAVRILEGKTTGRDAMTILGEVAQGDIIESIADIHAPKLSIITLMARKYRELGKKVSGATIGMFARKAKSGDYKASDLSANTKPLNDTGYMVSTITNITESTR